jgi:membrane protein implicated in regulation of membrane protease activity
VQPSDHNANHSRDERGEREDRRLARAFLWIGIGIGTVAVGAVVAYAVVQAIARANRPPDDPTSQRIQQLIDEANSLLKTLDEQRHSA